MIKILLNICSLILIFLILIRLPEKSGGSINLGSSLLGSPKKTSQTLENIMWGLVFLFFILAAVRAIQTL